MKTAGAVTVAACAGVGRLEAKELKLPIGLQLYSVRELLEKDFDGTLAKLRTAGIQEVEAAGYYGRTSAEFGTAMNKAGLRCTSTHHPLGVLLPKEDELIEYGHRLNLDYIVCPAARGRDPEAKGEMTLDDWRWAADQFNRIGEKVKAAGMGFGYHNHMHEFKSIDGVVIYDELLKRTDPKLVIMEMDCGWVHAAGADPVAYIAKNPKRYPLLHVKDMMKGADGEIHSPVLGKGTMDTKAILRVATGLKHYYIEQEEFDRDPIEAVRVDAVYMHDIRF